MSEILTNLEYVIECPECKLRDGMVEWQSGNAHCALGINPDTGELTRSDMIFNEDLMTHLEFACSECGCQFTDKQPFIKRVPKKEYFLDPHMGGHGAYCCLRHNVELIMHESGIGYCKECEGFITVEHHEWVSRNAYLADEQCPECGEVHDGFVE